MITAKEAFDIANEIHNKHMQEINEEHLVKISNNIEEAVNRGEFQICYGFITVDIKKVLEDKGYTVSDKHISWKLQ